MNYPISIDKNVTHKKIKPSLVFYVFCAIYAPPIIQLNFIFILSLYSLTKILLKRRRNSLYIFKQSGICNYLFLHIGIAAYILIILCVNVLFTNKTFNFDYNQTFYRLLVLIPCQIICIIYIIDWCRQLGYGIIELLLACVYAGLIQSFIVICALNPAFKEILIEIMKRNTGQFPTDMQLAYRYYGFSATLLDTFGYGTGLLFGICIGLGGFYKPKYFILSPVIILPAVLNSRTGLLVALIGVCILILILLNRNLYDLIKLFLVLILLGILVLPLYFAFEDSLAQTFQWVFAGFENLISFIIKSDSQYYEVTNVLFSNRMWQVPDNFFQLLFGTGHTIFGSQMGEIFGFASDVGYINYIWLFGVTGTVFYLYKHLLYYIKLYKFSFLYEKYFMRYLIYFLGASFFIMLIKGNLLGYNPGVFINTLLIFYIFLEASEKRRVLHD